MYFVESIAKCFGCIKVYVTLKETVKHAKC